LKHNRVAWQIKSKVHKFTNRFKIPFLTKKSHADTGTSTATDDD